MMCIKLQILQHSLGLNQYGQGRQYRNHFVAGPGSTDFAICIELVEAGLRKRRSSFILTAGDEVFHVTPAGVDFVALNSTKPPKVSKSKARYLRFLEYGDGFDSFLQFCRWDASSERSWNGGHA